MTCLNGDMAAGKTRSTRKLRAWIVEQVSSGKYPGLMWDDEAKTMFRIPWKHAGKQDFRKDEDAAIFKAWAEFKGKLTDSLQDNPANWKTRLRCALNKSPEFSEVMERAQLDISEPYKVYRLVPPSEQGLSFPDKKCKEKLGQKLKRKRRRRRRRRSSSSSSSSDSDSDDDDASQAKQIKTEEVTSQLCVEETVLQGNEATHYIIQTDVAPFSELSLDVRIEETVDTPAEVEDSFDITVHYLGQEVLQCHIQSTDMRISYLPSSPTPSTPAALNNRFPRIPLPEPPTSLAAGSELQALVTLLPFMVRGVALTSSEKGVYGKRFCQGRVFWTGPHATTPGLHKMERNKEPVMLFSKEVFKQQLDHYRTNGGEPPQCGITLCFGEELSVLEDPSKKLIIVQILLPWAEKLVQSARSVHESFSILQSLASQSPLGEVTLNLVTVPLEAIGCGTA